MSLRHTALVAGAFAVLTVAIIVPVGLGNLRIERVHAVDPEPVPAFDTTGRSTWLPPWFGDTSAPPVSVRGTVFASELPVMVHLGADVPDPGIWAGRDVRTDAHGQFDFGPQRQGRYLVQAYGPSQMSRVVSFDTTIPSHALEVFAYPCVQTDGIALVDAPDEPPLARAQLQIAGRVAATSDGRGLFHLCMTAEPVSAFLEAAGFRPYERIIAAWAVPAAGPTRFFAQPGIPLRGRVNRMDGGVVGGLGVGAISYAGGDLAPTTSMIVTTDRDGWFSYDGLPEGEYVFTITSGLRAWRVEGSFELFAPTSVELEFSGPQRTIRFGDEWGRDRDDPDAAWVRGRVVRAGLPVPDAEIEGHVWSGADVWRDDTTRSHADGTFELFVSSDELEDEQKLELRATQRISDLAGARELLINPGDQLEGITIEMAPR